MSNRISMASFDNMNFNKPLPTIFNSVNGNETELLEAGMVKVLSELAKMYFLQLGPESLREFNAKWFDDACKDSDKKLNSLNPTFSKEQEVLFDEYVSAENFCNGLCIENSFINGFIQGYQFLKQLHESTGGL